MPVNMVPLVCWPCFSEPPPLRVHNGVPRGSLGVPYLYVGSQPRGGALVSVEHWEVRETSPMAPPVNGCRMQAPAPPRDLAQLRVVQGRVRTCFGAGSRFDQPEHRARTLWARARFWASSRCSGSASARNPMLHSMSLFWLRFEPLPEQMFGAFTVGVLANILAATPRHLLVGAPTCALAAGPQTEPNDAGERNLFPSWVRSGECVAQGWALTNMGGHATASGGARVSRRHFATPWAPAALCVRQGSRQQRVRARCADIFRARCSGEARTVRAGATPPPGRDTTPYASRSSRRPRGMSSARAWTASTRRSSRTGRRIPGRRTRSWER